ncbi:MAG TPA: hypothetical protein VFN74_07420 [Chloroflexota bacterium]|nr:hypothetical protein [Chloroflexota bacterium]
MPSGAEYLRRVEAVQIRLYLERVRISRELHALLASARPGGERSAAVL